MREADSPDALDYGCLESLDQGWSEVSEGAACCMPRLRVTQKTDLSNREWQKRPAVAAGWLLLLHGEHGLPSPAAGLLRVPVTLKCHSLAALSPRRNSAV